MTRQAFICDAIRTPFGRYGGALSSVRTDDLGAIPLKALMARNAKVDWEAVTDVLYGCANHAARILDRIGLAGLFDAVWDIRSMAFEPKPMPQAYARVMALSGVEGPRAAMFDDLAHNLVPARALGMTTIWLKTDAPYGRPLIDIAPGAIDHETDNLTHFLQSIRI